MSDFSLQWCKAIFADNSWTSIPTASQALHSDSTENRLVASTLATPSTVRDCQTFIKQSHDASILGTSILMLFALGSDLNGISGVCHGAVVTLMLDEGMGQLMACVTDRNQMITANLIIRFKRPLLTPAVVSCRSWVEREPKGRKLWIRGEVGDGIGGVYAEGEASFMKRREVL